MDIDEYVGLALGCIGMSMDDFCRCTPTEFRAVFERWNHLREEGIKDVWNRTRMMCVCMLQPYSKEAIVPEELMRFAWDKENLPAAKPELSHEELMDRYRKAMKARGLS